MNIAAPYKVEHYKQKEDLSGYTLEETEELIGAKGKTATAKSKIYTGFIENTKHNDRINTGIVEEDGSLVLKLYYDKIENVNITVNKIWNDNDNSRGKRPTSLILKVLEDEKIVATQTVSEAQNWSYTFSLPKTDEEGHLKFYTVDEEEVNSNDLQYYSKYINGYNIVNTFRVPDEMLNIAIRKVEKDTSKGLKGAKIQLIDSNGNKVYGETDENGYTIFIGLKRNETYTYKETKTPRGYKLNSSIYSFKIEANGEVTDIIGNRIIENEKTKVIITTGAPHSKVEIYDKNGNPIIGSNGMPIVGETDDNGKITISGMGPGEYTYKQTEVPEGYVRDDNTYTFIIDEDGNVTFGGGTNGFIDNKRYGYVTIRKYEIGTTQGLEGAVIGIYDENGNPILDSNGKAVKITTNSNGIISFKIKPGTYKYKEEKAPSGYQLNDTVYTFSVSDNGTVVFENNTNGIIYDTKINGGNQGGNNQGGDQSNTKLPQTGEDTIIFAIGISIAMGMSMYYYIKIKE